MPMRKLKLGSSVLLEPAKDLCEGAPEPGGRRERTMLRYLAVSVAVAGLLTVATAPG